jgi:bifunctional non-homologous end joining protein LigD
MAQTSEGHPQGHRRASGRGRGGAPADVLRLGRVTVNHAHKIWWPEDSISKGDVATFYDAVAPRILPWMADHPLVAERCPEGMRGQCFFQKNFETGLPEDVPRASIRAASTGRSVDYAVGGSRRTLLAMVDLGCIAVHVMNCRTDSLDQPEWLAFDLDPGTGRFADAARVGQLLREELEALNLRSYPKTSGARGLHVFVPLRRGPDQDTVRAFARDLARRVARASPDSATVEMSKGKRGDRVFVDVLRNAFGQTIVPPYSVRRRPKAPVSTPLAWDEVTPTLDPSRFNLRTMARRLASSDPWRDFWHHRQALPAMDGAERS